MIQIKFPDELPPEIEDWKTRAKEITSKILAADNLEERHKLIDKYQKHWRKDELITWLSDLSCEKCWYTETKFGGDYQELEHFRPKKVVLEKDGSDHLTHGGYYWLAFDLDNYRLCKRRPNAKKGCFFPIVDERNRACCEQDDCQDELPLFLDPMDEEDSMLLSFNDDGKPVAAIGIEEQDKDRVLFTIEKYFLDERVLNKRRAETWSTARELFYKYLNVMKEAKADQRDKVAKRATAKNDLKNLKLILRPQAEFSSVARSSLQKTNDSMAIRILAGC